MRYVDGFVLVVPRKKLAAYRKLATLAGKVWREHGAVEYREAVGDDLKTMCGLPFPKLAKLRKGEVVFFSWIVYRSKAHRNRVNAKVMKDKRILESVGPKYMPFDWKRMSHAGFKIVVDR